jgi:hypothetical protein
MTPGARAPAPMSRNRLSVAFPVMCGQETIKTAV